jgi:hypothetical protein
MPPRKLKETDGIMQWVNTGNTNKPRYKLQEQALITAGETTQMPSHTIQASLPVIKEPADADLAEGVQPSFADMNSIGFNNLEFPIRKRKV